MKPDLFLFLATHSLFTRSEFARALSGRAEATVDAHLSRLRRQGRVAKVKRGLFVRLPPDGSHALPDFIALASRMAPDAAVVHHTALEVHGLAQSSFERLTFATWTGTKAMTYLGRKFVPVRPRPPLRTAGGGERWIEARLRPVRDGLLAWSDSERLFLERLLDDGVIDGRGLHPDPAVQKTWEQTAYASMEGSEHAETPARGCRVMIPARLPSGRD